MQKPSTPATNRCTLIEIITISKIIPQIITDGTTYWNKFCSSSVRDVSNGTFNWNTSSSIETSPPTFYKPLPSQTDSCNSNSPTYCCYNRHKISDSPNHFFCLFSQDRFLSFLFVLEFSSSYSIFTTVWSSSPSLYSKWSSSPTL